MLRDGGCQEGDDPEQADVAELDAEPDHENRDRDPDDRPDGHGARPLRLSEDERGRAAPSFCGKPVDAPGRREVAVHRAPPGAPSGRLSAFYVRKDQHTMITTSAGVQWLTKEDVEPHLHVLPSQWRARVREHRSYNEAALDRNGLRGTEEEHKISIVNVELLGILEGTEKTPSIGLSYTDDGYVFMAAWAHVQIENVKADGVEAALDQGIAAIYRLLAKRADKEVRWREAIRLYLMCSPNAVDRHRFEGELLDHDDHWQIRQLGDYGVEAWCLAYLGRPSESVLCSKCAGFGYGDHWIDPTDCQPVCPVCKGSGVVPAEVVEAA